MITGYPARSGAARHLVSCRGQQAAPGGPGAGPGGRPARRL